MTPRLPDLAALRTAIVLVDRPSVGLDGHPGRERLPPIVRLKATVVGTGPVACSVDRAAMVRIAGAEQPTWNDLQAAWQVVAMSIQAKIRAGRFDGTVDACGWPAIRFTEADVDSPTLPAAGKRSKGP